MHYTDVRGKTMILDNIHNYYEKLVLEELRRQMAESGAQYDNDTQEDILCVALNDLPPRYVRHTVDIIYYMTGTEREAITNMIRHAVQEALIVVARNPHSS